MSFYVYLMNNTEPYNKIRKNLPALTDSSVVKLDGTLKDGCSLVNPRIMFEISGSFPNANYAYIPEFGRYYFMKEPEADKTNLFTVEMHCDVLTSFASGILSSPAIVSRSSNNFNMLMNDDHYYCQENPHIFTKAFPGGFDTSTASYVLALVGQSEAVT